MQNQKRSQLEFVVLMAALMSIVALSIDAVLPALPAIGNYLNVIDPLDNPKLITTIFLGLGIGQLIFGPLSDSFGRKPIVYSGFIVFIIASIICISTKRFEIMLLGRVLQGIGLAAPRTMCIAMVRDSYEGDLYGKNIIYCCYGIHSCSCGCSYYRSVFDEPLRLEIYLHIHLSLWTFSNAMVLDKTTRNLKRETQNPISSYTF